MSKFHNSGVYFELPFVGAECLLFIVRLSTDVGGAPLCPSQGTEH